MDRSFLASRDNDALAAAIIALGENLALDVVAEGIEHADQATWLQRSGVRARAGLPFRPAHGATTRSTSTCVERNRIGSSARGAAGIRCSIVTRRSTDPEACRERSLLSPLRHRDFRVLWTGMAVSLLGDGIFLVAVAWQAYLLWNAPAALALVGIGMTVPTIAVPPSGGRRQRPPRPAGCHAHRRRRAGARCRRPRSARAHRLAAVLGARALRWPSTALRARSSFPRSTPSCPIFSAGDLAAANSLDQFVRPIALAPRGTGDGRVCSCAWGRALRSRSTQPRSRVSGVAVLLMRPPARRGVRRPSRRSPPSSKGFAFVRRRVWLWGTLLSAALAYLVFLGPAEVLLPYVVKNDLHASAGMLGLVFAAGGLGAVGAAIVMAQRREPRRNITFMYVDLDAGDARGRRATDWRLPRGS